MTPPPALRRRALAGAPHGWPAQVHPVLQRVYAARGVLCPADAEHRLARLLPPQTLGGLPRALDLIEAAIAADRRILVAGDFDADGATGCAVALRGLRMLGARNVGYVVPNRFEHGYGLSPALVATLDPAPDLLITVDNGISSLAGVDAARARGVAVIVTDHHLPGERLPAADAIVNPNLPGDPFPSKALAGVGVMIYLLLALRARLFPGAHPDREDQEAAIHGRSSGQKRPDLAALLDLVALGTVADLVPLDFNNRVLVDAGLKRIRAGRACAGVAALVEASGRSAATLVAADLGYALGPRINAAGRLEDMGLGVECLLTDDAARARELATLLSGINDERRGLQAAMVEEAEAMVARAGDSNAIGVALFDPGWHAGVVGLVASKLKERLHRPVIAFAPAGEGSTELRGSARSIAGFHIRDALAEVDARHPGLLGRYGGHAMAAGLSLRAADFARFAAAFDAVARERIGTGLLSPVLHTDGGLQADEFGLALAQQLRDAGPWGQAFPEPLFDDVFECVGWRAMGERHLRLDLRDPRDGRVLQAVHFGGHDGLPPPALLRAAYELGIDDWQGRTRLRLLLRHREPA
ncbi:MAG: single-stranded-DNA-specific exonuclease RecJ [Mizugakiibacter sp.]|uniref:single-stranded-DNA-specific exonuclease RecJ n=1 Tax=Mizugakiibacter sp. TaxID=1972610 RepID=UPI0031CA2544|nr:single-stranded-DNA-specific exonuclease RecJ [Xanthomonadaceae bacterium]